MIKGDSKTKNSSRNFVFGTALKFYQLLIPFIIRTVIIRVLGMEYVGLNSLFSSVLQVLNIAELGVGSVMIYSMYKPIEEGDTIRICALMRLYKIYYRIIGIVILGIGLVITPFIPLLITGDVPPDIDIFVLYFLNLGATVLSYWLFAYKNSLFMAHQRNDVISKVTIITNTIMYMLQISLLVLLKNYYSYVIVIIVLQVINNILVAFRAKKYFPEYKAEGRLPEEEVKKVNNSIKDIFYYQLGLIITTAVDSIVISAFLGLVPLAIYQNYYYILNAIIGFFLIFFQSCRASVGTNLIAKTEEENFKDYKFITFIVIGALSFCISSLLCMFQPFIELWVGKENQLDYFCVVLFGIYLLVYELGIVIGVYKDASGKWHADRFRPLLTASVNLVTNIILVNIIGIYGILISTIVSFVFVYIPWLYHRVFIDVFDSKHKTEYLLYLLKKIVVLVIIVLLCVGISSLIHVDSLLLTLFINLCICSICTFVLYYICNRRDSAMDRTKNIIRKVFKRKV